jgi:inositol phosphorylceramide synthase catalytic subunit
MSSKDTAAKYYLDPENKDIFWIWIFGPALMLYGASLIWLQAFRSDHAAIFCLLFLLNYHPRARPLFKLLFPIALFAIVYDMLRFITPYAHARIPVHVSEPYWLELSLFGMPLNLRQVIPCEFFEHHRFLIVDLLAAFAYCFFIFESVIFSVFIAFRDPTLLRRFTWAFFVASVLAFITYYVYPAAPPWYVLRHGLGPAIPGTLGDAAYLAHIDDILGIRYFHAFYARSSNVFAAIPSMHVAYPMLVWLHGRERYRRFGWVFASFWLLVCFSAVYLGHHYIIDVLLGCAYALLTYVLLTNFFPQLNNKVSLAFMKQ